MSSQLTFNKKAKNILSIFFIFFLTCELCAQSCNNPSGLWINELGSVLQIDSIGDNGQIFGVYKSSTRVDGKTFSLNGWLNRSSDFPDDLNISFTVRWEGYGSITSWTGYCVSINGKPSIKTLWHLVRSGKEFDWERIISNSSTFTSLQK